MLWILGDFRWSRNHPTVAHGCMNFWSPKKLLQLYRWTSGCLPRIHPKFEWDLTTQRTPKGCYIELGIDTSSFFFLGGPWVPWGPTVEDFLERTPSQVVVFSHFFIFTPDFWGSDPIWLRFFKCLKPPTSFPFFGPPFPATCCRSSRLGSSLDLKVIFASCRPHFPKIWLVASFFYP